MNFSISTLQAIFNELFIQYFINEQKPAKITNATLDHGPSGYIKQVEFFKKIKSDNME